MNVSVSISTSDPHVGSLVQVYPSVEEAAAGIEEFLRSSKAAEEQGLVAGEPEGELDES
jgi:hypothetical protein